MSDILETTGKTVEEAIDAALRQLNAERGDVDIDILETETKGFLGIGAKPARVRVALKHDPARSVAEFLRETFLLMGIAATVETELTERMLNVNIVGGDASVLIGKHGQTLDALQYIVSLVLNKGDAPYINISLDTGGYRKKRRETLESLAYSVARKVKATKRSVRLEPMSANERRIIHSFLQNDKQIATFSEGDEPFRNIVIALKRGDRPSDRQEGKPSYGPAEAQTEE